VLRWLENHDAERALSTMVIAELAFGISKIRPDERAQRLADGLKAWRSRFAGRIFAFTEEAALSYGELMGEAVRAGRPMSAVDGMIAAIARVHSAPLATRNVGDFRETGVVLVDPWRG
jgi:predicted nucleic acid-binding protein